MGECCCGIDAPSTLAQDLGHGRHRPLMEAHLPLKSGDGRCLLVSRSGGRGGGR